MKKTFILLISILLLTGCTKKITCVKNEKNEDNKIALKSVYVYKNDKLLEINTKNTITFKSEKKAKEYYEQYKKTLEFNKQYGTPEEIKDIDKNIPSYKKKKFILESNYSEKDFEKSKIISKDEFIKEYEDKGYKCK